MRIITLTTDLGTRDYYAAALKGNILRNFPEANIVDITHQVSPFNVLEAAFILKSVYHRFPVGSIHIIGVDPEGGRRTGNLLLKLNDHYFLAPDNGVLSLICGDQDYECVLLEEEKLGELQGGRGFLAQRILAPAAAMLAGGAAMESLGAPQEIRQSLWGEPSYTGNALRGVILHIDHFGNAITNITKPNFMDIKGDRSFQVFIRNLRLQRIVSTYGDVAKGEALTMFADSDHLEIAIREGSAAQLLGLKVQDMLTIEFYG